MAETTLDSLRPLIAKARAEGKWLHCSYQNLWFSPDQLETENREGRFRWGAVNWTLRDPGEMVQQRADDLRRAERDYLDAVRRVSR